MDHPIEHDMETAGGGGGGIYRGYLWLAGNEGMEKNMETT